MKTIRKYTPVPEKEILKNRKHYDVVLPPMEVEEVAMGMSGQVADWGVVYLEASKAWSNKKSEGEKAIIFILDTGIADHPDLDANRRKQYDKNFTGDSPVKHPHGTHCAGICAALSNQEGIVGVAPKAGLVDVQVLNGSGSGTWAGVSSGVRHVADVQLQGADAEKVKIISMSLGGTQPAPELESAINYAISKGCIVVAAAGNSGFRQGQDTVNWPGAYPQVITVAALDPDNDEDRANQRPASYSSAGSAVDVAAPGSNVLSTILNGGYGRMSGTSMATPHVAGIAALIGSIHGDSFKPGDPNNQKMMESFLRVFALDLLDKGHDVRTGMGAPIVSNYLEQKPGDTPPPPPPPPPPAVRRVRFSTPAINYSRTEHAIIHVEVVIPDDGNFWYRLGVIRVNLRMVSIINEGEKPADLFARIQDQISRALPGFKAENIQVEILPIQATYTIV